MQGETPLADMQSGRSKSPYFCGVDVVAQVDPWDGGSSGFIQRAGSCAYVHGSDVDGAGLAVVDLSDPTKPEIVTRLMTPATAGASETLDVLDRGPRRLLIAGNYGGGVTPPGPAPMEIYDVSDCANPRLLAAFEWPANIHAPRITPDGMYIYAGRQFGIAGGMVMDISDLAQPAFLGDFPLVLPDGRQQRCHDLEFNTEMTRMYCAGSVPLIEQRKGDSAPSIWDISLVGRTDLGPTGEWPAIRFVSAPAVRGQGDHHTPLATIGGRRYMIAANELRCTAFPRIFDITDESDMRMVGEFRLESNERCLEDEDWARANRGGSYGLHYNSVVDDAWGDVALGMFNFMGSGLRIVDLRNPAKPVEIAYYHPGELADQILAKRPPSPFATTMDACMSKAFFVHGTEHIWFGCNSGLYVAQLAPEVKFYLQQD